MKLRLKNLLSKKKHKKRYICPKTGLKVSTPPGRCIKYTEESSKERILFVPVDKHLLEFARSKLKKDIDN